MKLFVLKVLLCLSSVAGGQLVVSTAYGQEARHATSKTESARPRSSVNQDPDGVAVKGYDVVFYFDQKKPMKGNPKYSDPYNGAKYNFISEEHLSFFAKSPESYLPQYGGYC